MNQTRLRIILTLSAYTYEFLSETIMSDTDFDAGCNLVDLKVSTSRPDLDKWWRENFDPSTGMWVCHHPEINKINDLYKRLNGIHFVLVDGRFIGKMD